MPFWECEDRVGAIAESELLEFRQNREGSKTFTERILEGQREAQGDERDSIWLPVA